MTEQPPATDPRPADMRTPRSLVIVNTGDGKGKSTAAFGMMLRALAREWNVAVVQFLKSGKWNTGEERMGTQLGVDWWTIGEGFTWDSSDIDRDRAVASAAWQHAVRLIADGGHRLVILDEITYALNWGWVDATDVVESLRDRPSDVSVVLTGRDAPQALIDAADTVTSMTSVKHAYESGYKALRGVDF